MDTTPTSPEGPYDERTCWHLPASVGPFVFVKREVHAPASNGVSYTYALDGGAAVATVYIYDFGMTDIPVDVRSQRVVAAFVDVLRGIVQSTRARGGQVLEIDEGAEVLVDGASGREILCNRQLLGNAEHPSRSVATLTVENGHFVKVRLTHDAVDPLAQMLADVFVRGIHHLLFARPVKPST